MMENITGVLSTSSTAIYSTEVSLTESLGETLLVILPLQITCTCVRFCFGIMSLVSNGLMIVAFIKYEDLRSVANAMLINLCVVDCLMGLANIINPISQHLLVDNRAVFLVVQYMLMICSIGEVTALLLVGIDRYLHLLHSSKYTALLTPKRTAGVILGFWLVLLLFGIPVTFKAEDEYNERQVEYYDIDSDFIVMFNAFWLQVIALVGLYTIIFWKVKKVLYNTVQPSSGATGFTHRYRIFKMTVIVLGVYVLSVGPLLICMTLILIGILPPETYILYILDICFAFYNLQIWINPMIYAWKDKKLNKAFRKLLHLKPLLPQPPPLPPPPIGIQFIPPQM